MNLTDKHIDYLKELMNIGVGKGASILNTMLNSHIQLQIPNLQVMKYEEIIEEIKKLSMDNLSAVDLPFKGQLSGEAVLIFPAKSAVKLVNILTDDSEDQDDSDLDSIKIGTLSEIGNIVLNSIMGTLCNFFKIDLRYSVPFYKEESAENLIYEKSDFSTLTFLLAQTRFKIEEMNIDGDIMIIFDVGSFDVLLELIDLAEIDCE